MNKFDTYVQQLKYEVLKEVIKKVDISNKVITVHLLEGLL